MKILELTRSFYPSIGGMEKFVDDRVKIYDKLNFNSRIITTNHSERKLTSKRLHDVTYLPSYTPYEIVPSLAKILRTDYDILSINQLSYFYSLQAVNAAWVSGKKIILTPHFYFHTNKFQLIKSLHNKFIVPRILKKVDRLICFTKDEADYWSLAFPIMKKKIIIIPHYFYQKENKSINFENNYGDFFLFLGRGEVNKRIDLLLKVFSGLDTKYQLVLTVGKDEIKDEIKNIIKGNNRIHLLGRVSEDKKQNLLATCSALILPTDFEAFGIVNFEASFYRKPLLLSELKVFKSILNNKGIIYFKNDLTSLKNAFKKFISLKEYEKIKMGESNFHNLENYSFEKISNLYLQLFKELG